MSQGTKRTENFVLVMSEVKGKLSLGCFVKFARENQRFASWEKINWSGILAVLLQYLMNK